MGIVSLRGLPRVIRDWLRKEEPDDVYWSIEEMTQKGGWKTLEKWGKRPDPPPVDKITPPTRRRCVRRRNGRIDENGVEWDVEHPDADRHYERSRRLDGIIETLDEKAKKKEEETEFGDRLIKAVMNGELDPVDPDSIKAADDLLSIQRD